MNDDIRVLIADDDPIVRFALSQIVSMVDGLAVVGEAEHGAEAVDLCSKLSPDVVMMDVQMPIMGGVEATGIITSEQPNTKVLAVTTLDTSDAVLEMLAAGATGYLLKGSTKDELATAVRQVHAGDSSLSPRVAALLVEHVRTNTAPPARTNQLPELTDRETEVLEHLAQGQSNAEMAREMFVSEGTIKAHLGHIMAKWNVRDRVQLLITAARAGLIDLR